MISKKCKLYGQISLKLKNNKFELKPISANGQIAVCIDVSGSKKTDPEKLSLTIKKDNNVPTKINLTLYKSDILLNQDEILNVSLNSNSFPVDFMYEEYSEFNKSIQVFGFYIVESKGGLVEVLFSRNDDTVITVLCDPRKNIHDAYKWWCTFWKQYYPSGVFSVCIDNDIVDEKKRFSDLTVTGGVNLYVAEKCRFNPYTEDDESVSLPWNQDGLVMVLHLSRLLGVEGHEIRLFDGARTLLSLDRELDMEDFRSTDTSLRLEMFYEVVGATIRCEFLRDEKQILEVMLVRERTLRRMKERLAFKMKIDWTMLIICGEDSRILTEEKIMMTEQFKYCSGLPRPNFSQKRMVGSGAFGKIYACTETTSGEIFAVKEFTVPFDGKTKCNIMKEVLTMSRLDAHDNIVRFLGIFVDMDDVSIAMEYMAGGSLKAYLTGPLKEEKIRIFSRDILRGLSHLHGLKIMHRDIKGDNVLLTADHLTAKLCDFGLSKILTDFSRSQKHTGECGSYRWMAPEVMRNEKYSFKADIWSFGATVVQMITGRVPCGHIETEYSAIMHIGQLNSIPFESSHLSLELKDLVEACLRATPAQRPPCDRLLSFPFFQAKTVLTEMEI